ncbi:MAG: stage V sporulation protein AD [Hydrogenibacillus schlegelii]|nr:stage V sporulation protein AD [Hydrogenibacillus schlegelii]
MRRGRTWLFPNRPGILASAAVGGPKEGEGPLAGDFDLIFDDVYAGMQTFEQAERKLLESAAEIALKKAGLGKDEVDLFLAGDLLSQGVTASFAARTMGMPFIGLNGACSTSMEGLALAALAVDAGRARRALTGTASHNLAAERTYRYPTEYGAQKPPTAQWTVTGAGAGIVALDPAPVVITAATVGRVVDLGLKDPLNMGAAMAPAAYDTIVTHLEDMTRSPGDYDLIVTGDLGRIGRELLLELLEQAGLRFDPEKIVDAGLMIYREDQDVFSGASGAASSAAVFYGHLMKHLVAGTIFRLLIVATGALMSPVTYQQGESVPAIAHAVAVERVM